MTGSHFYFSKFQQPTPYMHDKNLSEDWYKLRIKWLKDFKKASLQMDEGVLTSNIIHMHTRSKSASKGMRILQVLLDRACTSSIEK